MKTAMVIVQILVRLSGLFIIVLGVAFWTGRALTLIPIHEQLGYVFVGFAVGAGCPGCSRRCRSGLVGVTVLWGLAIPIIGVKQDLWLVGSAHWITKVVHLLTGVGAEGLAERLAASSRRPTAATQRTGHRAGTA